MDTSKLLSLNNLTTLEIKTCDIDDEGLKNICKLENLTELDLGYENYEGNNITCIEPIRNLKNLEILRLDNNNNNIEDISLLSSLKNLNRLALRGNPIKDLSSLKDIDSITMLNLGKGIYGKGLPIDSSQLKNISHLKLNTLIASLCNLDDISELGKITTLNMLDLSGNNISNIEVLNQLENLREVNLKSNNISDFSVINQETYDRIKQYLKIQN